jgi:hypothetical protein
MNHEAIKSITINGGHAREVRLILEKLDRADVGRLFPDEESLFLFEERLRFSTDNNKPFTLEEGFLSTMFNGWCVLDTPAVDANQTRAAMVDIIELESKTRANSHYSFIMGVEQDYFDSASVAEHLAEGEAAVIEMYHGLIGLLSYIRDDHRELVGYVAACAASLRLWSQEVGLDVDAGQMCLY